jgi:hypothetical protein
MKKLALAFPIVMLGFAAQASDTQHSHVSKYAGQEKQAIKSLSPDDIAELRRGGGWGLAKAAELNGVPGPAHLLEMKDEVPLADEQVSTITKIYEGMKAQAIKQGERLISLEWELESHFQNRTITDAILRSSLEAIAEVRKELRYVHLATHLQMPEILSPDQIEKYNALRGYSNAGPCANVPDGHDAEMWRKHNGCR